MQRAFKCCGKPFANYCCAICFTVFHPSCMERNTSIVKLTGHKILCSNECQATYHGEKVIEADHMEKIAALQQDLANKDKHIERLKRCSQAFEDVVFDAETTFTTKINNLTQEKESLTSELLVYKVNEQSHISDMEKWKEEKSKLEENIRELSILNRNLITTISTLESENDAYATEVKNLRQTVSDLQDDDGIKPAIQIQEVDKQTTSAIKKHKMLILGGENIRGAAIFFKNGTNRMYDINCQRKRQFLLDEMINDCKQLSKNFDKNDFVILFLTIQNAVSGKRITPKHLEDLLLSTSHTNLIVVGCSFQYNRPVLNNFIHLQNSLMEAAFKNADAVFVPVPALESLGGILAYESKRELFSHIIHNHIIRELKGNFLPHQKNGVYG